jgi:hypothetical protein
VTVEEVRPVLTRHLADVFDLGFAAAPANVASAFGAQRGASAMIA